MDKYKLNIRLLFAGLLFCIILSGLNTFYTSLVSKQLDQHLKDAYKSDTMIVNMILREHTENVENNKLRNSDPLEAVTDTATLGQ